MAHRQRYYPTRRRVSRRDESRMRRKNARLRTDLFLPSNPRWAAIPREMAWHQGPSHERQCRISEVRHVRSPARQFWAAVFRLVRDWGLATNTRSFLPKPTTPELVFSYPPAFEFGQPNCGVHSTRNDLPNSSSRTTGFENCVATNPNLNGRYWLRCGK